MKKKNNNPCLRSTFKSYLEEEGVLEETKEDALKLYISYQIRMALHESKITQTELAKKMKTSRAAVRRILDPTNPSITLKTLIKVVSVLGKSITVNIS